MNTKNLLIAGLVGGLAIAVLTNVPFLNLINCLVCAGFWGGGLLAAWLYRRLSGSLTVGQGTLAGLAAGVIAGILGLLLSLVGLAGIQGMVNSLDSVVPSGDLPNMDEIGLGVTWAFNIVGFFFTVLLGVLGGWIGGMIFKRQS